MGFESIRRRPLIVSRAGRAGRWVALVGAMTGACRNDMMDGTYRNDNDMITLELQSGKAALKMADQIQEFTFRVKGDKLILNETRGIDSLVLTRNQDGSISAGPFGALTKRP